MERFSDLPGEAGRSAFGSVEFVRQADHHQLGLEFLDQVAESPHVLFDPLSSQRAVGGGKARIGARSGDPNGFCSNIQGQYASHRGLRYRL
jgi:hypothetical protein